MTDIGVLLGGDNSNRSVIKERMQEVIEFEQAIAKVVCIFVDCYRMYRMSVSG